MTFGVSNNFYFNGKLEPREVDVDYREERWIQRYGFNPFARVDGTLK